MTDHEVLTFAEADVPDSYRRPFGFFSREQIRDFEPYLSERERKRLLKGEFRYLEPTDHAGVYVVRVADFVKIGSTSNIEQRVADIQTCSPFKVELMAVLSQDKSHERLFHRMFEKHHVRGEWFHLRGEVIDAILISRRYDSWRVK